MSVKQDARLEAIQKKIDDLAKEAKIIQVKRSSQERKMDGRRKVILGAIFMEKYPDEVKKAIGELTRKQDKAAFEGWSPKEKPQTLP